MDLQSIAFYALSTVMLVAALLVVTARNPVHSVLFLILAFFTAAGLFVLMGAEFLAMLLVVVYVGAVAVLFLFVVMMLDIDFASLRSGFVQYLPIGGLVAIVLAVEMGFMGWAVAERGAAAGRTIEQEVASSMSNTEQLGSVLYTDYIYFFQAAGMILLVAMIGAIVLTHRRRPGVKRQDVSAQTARNPARGMAVVQVKSGEGIAE